MMQGVAATWDAGGLPASGHRAFVNRAPQKKAGGLGPAGFNPWPKSTDTQPKRRLSVRPRQKQEERRPASETARRAKARFCSAPAAYRVLRSASHSLGPAQGRADISAPPRRTKQPDGAFGPVRSQSPARSPQKSALKSPLARGLASEP